MMLLFKIAFASMMSLGAIAVALVAAEPAHAQTSVTCASEDYQRTHCAIDTSRGVKLTEQLSKSSCNGNWGYGTGFVWVDEGCRARFNSIELEKPSNADNTGQSVAAPVRQTVTCASEDYQRTTCPLDTIQGIVLLRQLSRSSCANNWGYGDGFVWVQNGCRAEFGAIAGESPSQTTATSSKPSLGQPALERIQTTAALWDEPGGGNRVTNLAPGDAVFVYWNTRRSAAGKEYVYLKTATGEQEGWIRVGEGW